MDENKPYLNTPAQYTIWYGERSIEYTGYIASLQEAKEFVTARYGVNVEFSCCYPRTWMDGIRYRT